MLLATIVSVAPFGHRPRPGTGGAFLVLPVAVTVILGLAVTCFLKGRALFGVSGVHPGRWQRRLGDLVAGAPTPEDDS